METINTGGLLNLLNEKMRISSTVNSVPVIKLINTHNPSSYEELEYLIEYHYREDCECGIKSTGTVYDFGCRLYDAQLEFFGDYWFSLEECVQWEYDLFIRNSLKGNLMESKAVDLLNEALPSCFDVKNSSGLVDVCFRVDLEIFRDGVLICGVQVKPFSYVFMCDEVKDVNVVLNLRYDVDVVYLFYDDEGFFMNLDIVVADLLG